MDEAEIDEVIKRFMEDCEELKLLVIDQKRDIEEKWKRLADLREEESKRLADDQKKMREIDQFEEEYDENDDDRVFGLNDDDDVFGLNDDDDVFGLKDDRHGDDLSAFLANLTRKR